MNLGILKEIKEGEHRVILTPSEIAVISQDGHKVYVERSALMRVLRTMNISKPERL